MKKVMMNYWLDAAAFIAFCFLTSSGILLEYILPERSGHGVTVLGVGRHAWGEIHFYIALILFAIMALHIVVHWKWIVNMTRGRVGEASGRRLLVGVFALLVVILLAAAPILVPVENNEVDRGQQGWQGGRH